MGIVAVMFLALVIPMVLFHHREHHKSYTRHSRGIVNHDAALRSFLYKVEKSEAEIKALLREQTVFTSTKYRFREAEDTITFYSPLPDGSLDITYRIHIAERADHAMLKIEQMTYLWEKNPYSLLQNEFWHQLLDATPVPYSQQDSPNL